MAAGEGSRLRPVTERWPKPVLPIDGKPVVVTLLHQLAPVCDRIVVVTGYLAEQVEALVAPLPYDIGFARQPLGQGSADAVLRARATPPYLVLAADTIYRDGALGRFAAQAVAFDGAVAYARADRAPLWYLGERVHAQLEPLPGSPPYELLDVFKRADDAGAEISGIQIGRTRGLTTPVDLVRENFDFLR